MSIVKPGRRKVTYCLFKLLSLERLSCFITQDYGLVGYTIGTHSKELFTEKQHYRVSKKHGTKEMKIKSSDNKSSLEEEYVVFYYNPVIVHGLPEKK